MLRDEDFCRALTQSLGSDSYISLVRFDNAGLIRRTTSIPTAALAAKRFEIAVLSAVTSWFAAGLLSDVYAALLFFDLPAEIDTKISSSLAAFSFVDPWSTSGRVELRADLATIHLAGVPSEADLFAIAARMLGPAEDGSELREAHWKSWCREA